MNDVDPIELGVDVLFYTATSFIWVPALLIGMSLHATSKLVDKARKHHKLKKAEKKTHPHHHFSFFHSAKNEKEGSAFSSNKVDKEEFSSPASYRSVF